MQLHWGYFSPFHDWISVGTCSIDSLATTRKWLWTDTAFGIFCHGWRKAMDIRWWILTMVFVFEGPYAPLCTRSLLKDGRRFWVPCACSAFGSNCVTTCFILFHQWIWALPWWPVMSQSWKGSLGCWSYPCILRIRVAAWNLLANRTFTRPRVSFVFNICLWYFLIHFTPLFLRKSYSLLISGPLTKWGCNKGPPGLVAFDWGPAHETGSDASLELKAAWSWRRTSLNDPKIQWY